MSKTTLTCGCIENSLTQGIFASWEIETRECEPAVAYGMICENHLKQYNGKRVETAEYTVNVL